MKGYYLFSNNDGSYHAVSSSKIKTAHYIDNPNAHAIYGLPVDEKGLLLDEISAKLKSLEDEFDDCDYNESDVLEIIREAFPEYADEIDIAQIPMYYAVTDAKGLYHIPSDALEFTPVSMYEDYDSFGMDRSKNTDDADYYVEVTDHEDLDNLAIGSYYYHLYEYFHGDLYRVVSINGKEPNEDEKYLYVTLFDCETCDFEGRLISKDDRARLLAGYDLDEDED